MIGIYERISTGKQRTDSQHADLETWARAREDGILWYQDVFTGKTMDRPDFQRLLADVRAGRVKTVVVWRLDRLGRTASGLTAFLEELTALKVNFISLKDGIDLATPAGRLIANVLASVAAYETEVRGERVAAGLAAKRERVARGEETWNAGRPKGTPDKCTPELKNAVIREVQSGKGKAAVARAFKLSRQTVYTILSEAAVSSK